MQPLQKQQEHAEKCQKKSSRGIQIEMRTKSTGCVEIKPVDHVDTSPLKVLEPTKTVIALIVTQMEHWFQMGNRFGGWKTMAQLVVHPTRRVIGPGWGRSTVIQNQTKSTRRTTQNIGRKKRNAKRNPLQNMNY